MKLPQMNFNREALSHFDDMITREWLVTNGQGGYSSSSVLGVNTRKYHGLLIAAIHPPKDRRVFLAKLDEDVIIGNTTNRLGANEFQNGFFPQGYEFLQEFSISPFPKYTYSVQDVQIVKTFFMPYGKNAVVVEYDIRNKNVSDVGVKVFPIVNWRPFHSTTEKSKTQRAFQQESGEREAKIVFRSPIDGCSLCC
jgi:predicted glycogen debranching enzyme